jgi:hypothetical protein
MTPVAKLHYYMLRLLPAGCDQNMPVTAVGAYVPLLSRHHLTAHEHHGGMRPDVIIRSELVVYLLGVLTDDAANLPPDYLLCWHHSRFGTTAVVTTFMACCGCCVAVADWARY